MTAPVLAMAAEALAAAPVVTSAGGAVARRRTSDEIPEPTPRLIERFGSSYRVNAETGCWEWTMCRDRRGYGRTWFAGKIRIAHRLSYRIHVGQLDSALTIDHLCRNTCCVNPAHLEQVPLGVNLARSETPSSICRRKTSCLRGHPFDEENTLYNGERRVCRQCRKMHRQKEKSA